MMEAEIYHKTAMKQYEDGTTLIDLLSPTEKSKVLDLGWIPVQGTRRKSWSWR